jgi:hypothetical protein
VITVGPLTANSWQFIERVEFRMIHKKARHALVAALGAGAAAAALAGAPIASADGEFLSDDTVVIDPGNSGITDTVGANSGNTVGIGTGDNGNTSQGQQKGGGYWNNDSQGQGQTPSSENGNDSGNVSGGISQGGEVNNNQGSTGSGNVGSFNHSGGVQVHQFFPKMGPK